MKTFVVICLVLLVAIALFIGETDRIKAISDSQTYCNSVGITNLDTCNQLSKKGNLQNQMKVMKLQ